MIKKSQCILALNVGSTSIKSRVFRVERDQLKEIYAWSQGGIDPKKGHRKAFEELSANLKNAKLDEKITAVGHRVVHGGSLKCSVMIGKREIAIIKKHSELAPLHNPYNLEGISEAQKWFGKKVPQIAVFDTAFYARLPKYASTYALPATYTQKYNLYRYGFHGISHNYSMLEAAKILHQPASKLKLITVHLGGGSSITAIKHGVAVDTSMGFTPLEGLVMGTRSGDIDPGIIFYLAEKAGLNLRLIKDILVNQSGIYGLSGAKDFLELLVKVRKNNQAAQLAFEIFAYRIKKYIGAYAAILGGCDGIVFTGTVGAGDNVTKNKVVAGLRTFVLKKTKIMSVKSNEEKMIAWETWKISHNK
jgi:acetate kinase